MSGSIVRTSHSQLRNRSVRVDRNLSPEDGMGGAIDSYTTIIDQFWVRIWPSQHQERRETETGQTEVSHTHFGVGEPSVNGRTIRISDRFVDETNQQSWDVLAVERPRGDMPYNAMHRFVLRMATDDEISEGS